MRRYLLGLFCLLPMLADAAIVYTPGSFRLYKGNGTFLSEGHATLKDCTDAGEAATKPALNKGGSFECRMKTTAKGVASPPSPVNCVSHYGPYVQNNDWGQCVNDSQTGTETANLIIDTPPSNGGQACLPATTSRPVTRPCTVNPPSDSDGDGVPDSVDACPTVPANTPDGCPVVTPPPPSGIPPINASDPADAPLLKFGETAMRNWNFEGHTVTSAFNEGYGKWDLTATMYEPWLFDRASVAYIMWKRTGDARWKAEWNTLFTFYRTHIDSGGIFTPKGQDDTKYSYVRPFYYYEKETGDQQYRPIAKRIHDRWVAELPNNYSTSIALWTEREIGLALDAAIFYYKISNDPAALTRARAMVAHYGQVAASSGAPLHTLEQHGEEFDNAYASMKMTSSWMAALYFQALHEYYRVTGDQEALRQVSRYADFADQYGIVDGSAFHPEFTGVKVPYYLYGIGTFYDRETPSESDMVHCLDVGGMFKFAIEAKQALGQPTAAAQTRYNQMRSCAVRAFASWTRSTDYLPKYRISPPRQWNWWVRGSVE